MNRKRGLLIILLLVTSALPLLVTIPMAEASELVVSISHSYDDVWMTEAGNIFSNTFMVMMLDNEIGIHSFLRFQNLTIPKTAKINYATLKVYVAETHETPDPGSSVTIYGIDEPDCTPFTSDGSLWSLSRSYTSASVNWNTTVWSGYRSVNVTDIVKEIVNQYAWSSGNDLGLQILGESDSGQWPRSFEDYYHAYHEGQAQLTIVYDVPPGTPPGLPPSSVYVETYGEWDIWVDNTSTMAYPEGILEYVINLGTTVRYDTIHSLPGTPTPIETGVPTDGTSKNSQRKLARSSDNILYNAYYYGSPYQIYVESSYDEGDTWVNKTRISTYSGMTTRNQYVPAIAVGYNDTLHVVWHGEATGFTVFRQIWYAEYNGTDWLTPVRISVYAGMNVQYQSSASVSVNYTGTIHVTWSGENTAGNDPDIWYSFRNETSLWSHPLKISTLAGMNGDNQQHPSLAFDGDGDLHVTWQGKATGVTNTHIWHREYDSGWGTISRVSTLTGTDDKEQIVSCIATDYENDPHIVWGGKAPGFGNYEIWYNEHNGSWGTPVRISTYPDMDDYPQIYPSITGNSTDSMHVTWQGKAQGYTANDVAWYAEKNNSWVTPEPIQTATSYGPNTRWARFPGLRDIEWSEEYFLVDENGTVIDTWTQEGENFTDVDDLKDFVDDYVDPEGGDPLDPDPGTQGWDTEGPFTRFKMRLYFLFIGLACVFTPLWAMAYKKFDSVGYTWCFLIMVLGVGLLWSITGI